MSQRRLCRFQRHHPAPERHNCGRTPLLRSPGAVRISERAYWSSPHFLVQSRRSSGHPLPSPACAVTPNRPSGTIWKERAHGVARLRRCARRCLSVRSNRGRWAWRVITSGHNDAHIATRVRARIDLDWSSRHPIMHRYALESELTERGARRTRRAARRPTSPTIRRDHRCVASQRAGRWAVGTSACGGEPSARLNSAFGGRRSTFGGRRSAIGGGGVKGRRRGGGGAMVAL